MSRVLFAASGWLHPGWDESYYPPDIPEDWKLTYYANDFSAVVVPENFWKRDSLEELANFLEDIDPSFRVFLRVTTNMPEQAETASIRTELVGHFHGFFVDESAAIQASQLLASENYLLPVAQQQAAKPGWAVLGQVSEQVSAIVIRETVDKRQLREQFEKARSFMAEEQDVLVLLDVENADASYLKDLRVLLELMMIA